jgi:hypothetical protein
MVSVNVTSNEQHTIFTKGSTQITVNTDELIAALSELTGGQTWEDWMRRAEYAAAEYTKPIPIRGAKMQACTYKYMLDWIRDNVPLLPNTVGDGWIKVEDAILEEGQTYWVAYRNNNNAVVVGEAVGGKIEHRDDVVFLYEDADMIYSGVTHCMKRQVVPVPLPPAPNQNEIV